MQRGHIHRFLSILTLIAFLSSVVLGGGKSIPVIEEKDGQRNLVLPDTLTDYLSAEFPGSRLPTESELDPDMLANYYSRLIGIHPAITWGDFNGDRKQDYMMLLVTGQSNFGPLVELIVLDGEAKKGDFTPFRLGEIYNFKDQYVSFVDGKLTKGRFKKNAWYINWDKKTKSYIVNKS